MPDGPNMTGRGRAVRSFAVGIAGILAATVLLVAAPLRAANYTWAVPSGDWSNSANWGGTLPTINDNANILNGGTATITVPGAVCAILTLDSIAGSTIQMTSGDLTTGQFETGGAGSQFIGYSHIGNFVQSGGVNTVAQFAAFEGSYGLCLGFNAGSTGNYTLSGGQVQINGSDYGSSMTVGVSGTGTFTQTGGAVAVTDYNGGNFVLAGNPGSVGVYILSNSGQLAVSGDANPGTENVGSGGRGTFMQSGGTNSVDGTLNVGNAAGAVGFYTLNGNGSLVAGSEVVGNSGTGTFTQSAGTNSAGSLYLGSNAGSRGSYTLSGSGVLTGPNEFIGGGPTAPGLFQQTGGLNNAASLSIGSGSSYLLGGGTLQINGTLTNSGTFAGGPAAFIVNSIVDLSTGVVKNTGSMNVTVDANSLLIVPAGFNTATNFASFACLGVSHTVGTTLVVPAGQGFAGSISINDPVNCQGSIAAGSGAINLNNGLAISGTGIVNLGSGNLTVNDTSSGMSGNSTLSTGMVEVANGSESIGTSAAATFTQSGGINTINLYVGSTGLTLGSNPGSRGTYTLSGTGQLAVQGSAYGANEIVGNSGSGTFNQTGGVNVVNDYNGGNLVLAANPGSSGTYILSGSGQLAVSGDANPGSENVGDSGKGTFTQSGGTNTTNNLSLGQNAGSSGTYALMGNGQLLAQNETVGNSGSGSFTQSGGTNTASGGLNLGANAGSIGTYSLSGSGVLFGGAESLAFNSGGTALFQQTGGLNNAASLSIGSGSSYLLGGGTLQINGTLTNSGTFAGGPAAFIVNSIVDFSTGVVKNTGSMNVTVDANSLLIVPAGFNTATNFASFACLGVSHTVGTALVVPAGQGFAGSISINDPVNCQGSIAAGSGAINLNNGLVISGTGNVSLGSGNLTINDTNSGMSGSSTLILGIFDTANGSETIGNTGAASFTQSGGINAISVYISTTGLTLGSNSGSRGTYTLSGTGQLSVGGVGYGAWEVVGNSGSGTFNQTGGVNVVNDDNGGALILAANPGSSGTYILSGSGQLAVQGDANPGSENVGDSGKGTFTQSGGTNSVGGGLTLGGNSGGSGTYNLNGGELILFGLGVGGGTATFNFNGGTLLAGGGFATSLPMTLGTSGGVATFDTAGNTVTLNGVLSGPGGLNKIDSGTLILAATNHYLGTTTIVGGILNLAVSTALPAGGRITFAGGTLQYSNSDNIDYSPEIVGSTGPISIDTNGTNVTFASSLASSNSGGLTKIGNGVLLLMTTNGFSGNALVCGGTLALGSALSLQQNTLDTSGGGVVSFGSFTSVTFGGLAGTGPLALSNAASAAVALSVGNNNANTTFSGALSGPGSLTKIGTGALTVANTSSYSGPTAVNAGTFVVDGSLFSPVTINFGGTVVAGSAAAFGSPLTLSGGTLQAASVNALSTAMLAVNAGLIDLHGFSTSASSLSGSGTISDLSSPGMGTSTLSVNQSANTTFAGTIQNGPQTQVALTKGGGGVLLLTANNIFSGNTLVSGGTLALGTALALQQSTLDTSGSGILSFGSFTSVTLGGLTGTGPLALSNAASASLALSVGNNNANTTFSGALSGPGSLTKIGTGTLNIASPQSYCGPTVLANGTLKLGVPAPLSNLVARYTFANSNANDVTGNGNNGTLVGNPTFVAGVGGQNAIQLNGSQYISVPYASDLALSSFSVSLWVDSTSSSDLTVLKTFGSGSDWPFDIQINGAGHALHGDLGIGSSWLSTNLNANIPGVTGATTSYPTNAWHMITETVTNNGSANNATYQIYYDGQPANISVGNNGVCPGVGAPSFLSPGFTMRIGSNESTGLIGMISDVDIFGTALTSNQAASLYSFESQPSQQPAAALPNGTALTISANATLDLGGGNQQVASLSDMTPGSGGSVINSSAGGSVLTFSPSGGSTTFSGIIQGGGALGAISLVMSGSGTQVLAGSNSFTGGTTISGGTLAVANALALQNSTLFMANNNGLGFSSGLSAATLGGLAGSGNIALTNAALQPVMLSVGQNGQNSTYSGSLGGAGGLTKQGSGVLTLTAPSTYSGPTVIAGGVLKLPSTVVSGSIGIHFIGGNGGTAFSGTGGVAPMSNWNNESGFTFNGVALNNNAGASSGATFSLSGANSVWGTTSTNPLLNGYVAVNNFGVMTLTASNIPYARYSIYAYVGDSTAGLHEAAIVNGTNYYYATEGGSPNTYLAITSTNAANYQSGNFIEVDGLSGGSQMIKIAGTTQQYGGLNSVEIVNTTPVVVSLNVLPVATALSVAAGAAFDLGGGSQQVASLSDTIPGSGGSIINSNAAAVAVLTLSASGGSTTFSGGIQGAISMVMGGSGTQVLGGSNTYTGSTTINTGKLFVNGALASPVSVNNGGALGGAGFLSSVLVGLGGTLAPGDPQGVLHLSGNLNLLSGAAMDFDLDGSATDDEVSMPSGVLLLNNQQFSDFTFAPLAGFGPGSYALILAGSVSGSLASNSGTIDGLPATLAVQGNNELVLNVMPEPSTLALLAAGGIGVAGYGWRRRTAGRSAKSKALDQSESQEDGPAILSFPSHTFPAQAARRAA